MDREKKQEHYIESLSELYATISVEELFARLNGYINKSNELSSHGISDSNSALNIRCIIQILHVQHGISNFKIKEQKYFGHLIEKYAELNKALDRTEDTGGYGKDRILYEMEKIEKNLNIFGLDNEGNFLKSLIEIKTEVKENVRSRLT